MSLVLLVVGSYVSCILQVYHNQLEVASRGFKMVAFGAAGRKSFRVAIPVINKSFISPSPFFHLHHVLCLRILVPSPSTPPLYRVKENKVEQFRPGVNGGSSAVAPPAAALPQDRPLHPPSPPSPVESNRNVAAVASAAAPARASGAGSAGLRGEGVSSLQKRQLDRRRGGGTSPRSSSVTLKTGDTEVASPRVARGKTVDRGGRGRFANRGPSMNEPARGRMQVDSDMRRRLYPSPSPERAGSDSPSATSAISYMHNRDGRQHHPEENDEERVNGEVRVVGV